MDILNGKNVLLADDDQFNVYAITAALEEYGLNIIVATNGAEAVEAVTNNRHIDMVLMDIMMPEMNGYEAMTAIRNTGEFNDLPIIALTAKAMRSDIDKCFESGATDYMSKPIDIDGLVAIMAKWMK